MKRDLILKLKRTLCFVGVATLSLIVLPSALVGEVSAATCSSSEGPRNARELQEWFDAYPRRTNIKLCGNINGTINLPETYNTYTFTIDLNGNSVSNGINVPRRTPSSLIINDGAGGGKVSGAISSATSKLTISGGTFTSDPTNYVKDGSLDVYKISNNLWSVEQKLSLSVPNSLTIRRNGAGSVAGTVAPVSGSSLSYASDKTSVATVDGNGVVTGVAKGEATMTVTAKRYNKELSKTVSVKVLPLLETVSAKNVVVMKGTTAAIETPTVVDDIEGVAFSYESADTSVATVDENGTVTGVAAGTATITITATHTDELGEMTKTTKIVASVFDVKAGTGDEDEIAAGTVRGVINEGLPEDMEDASEHQKEVFGAEYVETGNALKNAMNEGSVISTNVNIKDSTDENAIAKIDEALKNVKISNIKYYDVTVGLAQNGDQFGLLHKLDEKITFAIAKVEKPADGLERQYYLVAYHEGDEAATVLVEGEDYEIIDGVIYVRSDRFSTFAVAYVDTLKPSKEAKAPNTGKEAVVESSATTAGFSVMSATLIATTILMSAAILARRK